MSTEKIVYLRALFERSIALKQQVMENHLESIAQMADICVESLAAGGKLLVCGNGGSAADAQHLAAELLVRLRPDVNRDGIPAIALTMDSSTMTACGNDYGYEELFERMVMALGRKGDVLLGITTSGKSANVNNALRTARARGLRTIGLLGGNGGASLGECDAALVVPSRETGRIQESHITAGHALMELIEDGLLARGAVKRAGDSNS
jgi:D-sedoheptulose 7-phosphate isomerase